MKIIQVVTVRPILINRLMNGVIQGKKKIWRGIKYWSPIIAKVSFSFVDF